MTSLDSKINNLLAGQSMISSQSNNIICSIERGSDGKELRFVRTYKNGSFEVYKKVSFHLV